MSLKCFDRLIAGEFRCPLAYEFWPAEDESSRKVVVVLHGRGDSLEGYHWLPQALESERLNFLFLNAPDRFGSGFSWYERPPRQGPGIVRSRLLLFDLLNRLQSECDLAPSDLFLFGFSQGSLLSLDVALRYPQPLGGVVAVSGYVFFLEEYPAALSPCVSQQHILCTHGTMDEVVPLEPTRAAVETLRSMGVPIDFRIYTKEHTFDPSQEIPEIRQFLKHLLELC